MNIIDLPYEVKLLIMNYVFDYARVEMFGVKMWDDKKYKLCCDAGDVLFEED